MKKLSKALNGISKRRELARLVLPCVYAAFALCVVTGLALFFYDPLEVGSHVWLTPKLLFVALGLANALWFNKTHLPALLLSDVALSRAGVVAGTASILFWALAILCGCLNAEGPPRLLIGS